jgi:ribosomal protein L14E/L6E/L27E
MLQRAFANLRDVQPDAEGHRSTTVGKYEIDWDKTTETLKVSDSERGTLYEAVRGEVAKISDFSEEEKQAFARISNLEQSSTLQDVQTEAQKNITKNEPLREEWEKSMVQRAFDNLKEVQPDADGNRTTEVGKYKIDWDKSTQTLKVSDSSRGTLYEAVRGETAKISNFSDSEKEAFGKVQASSKNNAKEIENG